jgi:recombinational DNA repair protein RecR
VVEERRDDKVIVVVVADAKDKQTMEHLRVFFVGRDLAAVQNLNCCG